MIENVGNLVCPALFDLGERGKVVLLSVAEGDDKPLKYPHMFRAAAAMVVTKLDLLPHVRFDLERCIAEARALDPELGGVRRLRLHRSGPDRLVCLVGQGRGASRRVRRSLIQTG